VESEQRLLNLMRAGDWAAAVPLALELEQVRGAARRGAARRWSACVAGFDLTPLSSLSLSFCD